jgi:hypothetical protein
VRTGDGHVQVSGATACSVLGLPSAAMIQEVPLKIYARGVVF